MPEQIFIGSDHAGYGLKKAVSEHLRARGFAVLDVGAFSEDSVDYPDYAHAVADGVAGAQGLGILICGSGNGVNIVANKHVGVRAALAWNPELARLARQHNDANILSLPARFIDSGTGLAIVDAFLAAAFEGGRHARRVEKIESSN